MLVSVYITNAMEDYFISSKKVQILTQANILALRANTVLSNSYQGFDELVKNMDTSKGYRVYVVDINAKVIYDSNEENSIKGKTILTEQILGALQGKDEAKTERTQDGELVFNVSAPFMKDGDIVGAILMQVSGAEIEEYMSEITRNLLVLSVIVSLLIGVFSFILASIITAPIQDLTKKVKEAIEADSKVELEAKGSGEVAELIKSFNELSDKIEKQEIKRQEFVSNASHELKTPLSSIKLICDSIIESPGMPHEMVLEFLEDMNNEVDRLTRIVDKLLKLTRMDDKNTMAAIEFTLGNINKIVLDIVKSLSRLAEKKNISLNVFSEDEIYSMIEPDRLHEAIYNIVDNSIKYTPEGGEVTIRIHREENRAIITVKDTGIGISEKDKYLIFERFYRVDKARARDTGGTGLGLSIALAGVELHGGNIEVASEEGKGTTFKIMIPITTKL
ncbi:MAG: cell wall metabolism sensor histidine kinase WalK [Clostridiaceae bacterium]|nr:cell wall metabolism sensor histidine kinase WalK [Clostridiaceae bacterium]